MKYTTKILFGIKIVGNIVRSTMYQVRSTKKRETKNLPAAGRQEPRSERLVKDLPIPLRPSAAAEGKIQLLIEIPTLYIVKFFAQ